MKQLNWIFRIGTKSVIIIKIISLFPLQSFREAENILDLSRTLVVVDVVVRGAPKHFRGP
jgi:hypothetical protein